MNSDVVIVPWDFSEYSQIALRYALQHYPNDCLRVICVLEYPNPYAYGGPWTEQQARESKQKCRDDFRREADPDGRLELAFVATFGEPAETILEFANTEHADLILMATHGRTGLQNLLLGSVAQRIVSRAHCPVLLLPSHYVDGLPQVQNATESAAAPDH